MRRSGTDADGAMAGYQINVDTFGPHRGPLTLPLIFAQAQILKWTMQQLPEPADAREGSVSGAGEPLRVLAFGDSAAVAVGATSQSRGLAACVAGALAARTLRAVHWRAHGRSGMTALDCERELADITAQCRDDDRTDDRYDLIVTSLGGNDAVKLSASAAFTDAMQMLLRRLRPRLRDGGQIILGRAPPFACSPVFKNPLRALVAWRTERINALLADIAARENTLFCDEPKHLAVADLAVDQFHPNEASYRFWGEHLVGMYLRCGNSAATPGVIGQTLHP